MFLEEQIVKKMIALILALMVAVTLVACVSNNNDGDIGTNPNDNAPEAAPIDHDGIEPFSYDEDKNTYTEGELGVVSEGFYNTDKNPITNKEDAIALAKNEVKEYFNYDTISVYYDDASEMWMVLFSTAGRLGGCQSVYMNRDGLTTLIVFGE